MGEGSQIVLPWQLQPGHAGHHLAGKCRDHHGSLDFIAARIRSSIIPITGPYTLTLSGKSDAIANLNVANNFGQLRPLRRNTAASSPSTPTPPDHSAET